MCVPASPFRCCKSWSLALLFVALHFNTASAGIIAYVDRPAFDVGGPVELIDYADSLDGYSASDFALQPDLDAVSAILQQIGPTLDQIGATAAFHGQAIQIGSSSATASTSNAGTIRFDSTTNQLQISDGTQWRVLAYAD